jgi:hypothetical protein
MEVHEHPIVQGPIGEIEAPIEHNDTRGIDKFIERHRQYALWEARRASVLCQGDPEAWCKLTERQRFEYRHLQRWWWIGFIRIFC